MLTTWQRTGDPEQTVHAMIQRAVERMYTEDDDNRFLRSHMPMATRRSFTSKDFNSGAMIENVVARAKVGNQGLPRYRPKGIRVAHLLSACVDEFRENEDLPNTTNPDDWARISGKKGERIIFIRTLVQGKKGTEVGRSIDTVANTGQYL